MKKLCLLLTLPVLLCTAPAWAQAERPQQTGQAAMNSWTGTIVDADCHAAQEKQPCEVKATTQNYGLITADGKFVEFDAAGNAKVHTAMLAEKKTVGKVSASIKGSMKDDMISVDSVDLR